jgi:hypothetical protein
MPVELSARHSVEAQGQKVARRNAARESSFGKKTREHFVAERADQKIKMKTLLRVIRPNAAKPGHFRPRRSGLERHEIEPSRNPAKNGQLRPRGRVARGGRRNLPGDGQFRTFSDTENGGRRSAASGGTNLSGRGQFRTFSDTENGGRQSTAGGGTNLPGRGQFRTFSDTDEMRFFWKPPNAAKRRHGRSVGQDSAPDNSIRRIATNGRERNPDLRIG